MKGIKNLITNKSEGIVKRNQSLEDTNRECRIVYESQVNMPVQRIENLEAFVELFAK